MFGFPDCGTKGCPFPGIVQFSFSDEAGEVFVFLCPACIRLAPELLAAVADARREMRRELIERREQDTQETPLLGSQAEHAEKT